jgi:sulfur carrier protein ThiS
MFVIVNGQTRSLPEPQTLGALLRLLSPAPPFAVARNTEVVPRGAYEGRIERESVKTACMARELFETNLIKLEVIGDEVNLQRQFIGIPDSLRFPRFASLDLQVTRPLTLRLGHRKVHTPVGVSVFNLLNRFNPRDVQSDVDSLRYGALFDGVGRTVRGKFIFDF